MYFGIFIVLTLSLSQFFVKTASFELKITLFKLNGVAIKYIGNLKENLQCYLNSSRCKLDSKQNASLDDDKGIYNTLTVKIIGDEGKTIGTGKDVGNRIIVNTKPLNYTIKPLMNTIKPINDTMKQKLKSKEAIINQTVTQSPLPDQSTNTKESLEKILRSGIVSLNSFDAEVHTLITPDGYVLTLHRMPSKVMNNNSRAKKRSVILLHGLLGSSTDWILLGPNNSLPYLLKNEGFDVWLANARGNKYSKTHATRSVHSPEYWDFSWHEIGLYDVSSIIDYVKEKTFRKTQLFCVAHSMGATALMVLLSTSPQYNADLSLIVLLAPLVYMQQAKGPLRLLAEFQNLDYNATVKILGGHRFNPSEQFINIRLKKFCRGDRRLCHNPLLLLSDGGKAIANTKHMANIMTHVKAEGSVKTILHYGQLINTERFGMFDAGSKINIKKFRTVVPPTYNLRDVKSPIALFSSHDDWLSTVPGIHNLLSHLPNPILHHIVQKPAEEFNHFDFVWGEDAPELAYAFVMHVMDQY